MKGTNAMIGKVFPNGAEVIAEMPDHFNSDITVILVKWREHYITAKIGIESDKEWFWGNYFPLTSDGFVRAFADFMKRSGRSVEPVE